MSDTHPQALEPRVAALEELVRSQAKKLADLEERIDRLDFSVLVDHEPARTGNEQEKRRLAEAEARAHHWHDKMLRLEKENERLTDLLGNTQADLELWRDVAGECGRNIALGKYMESRQC